MYGRQDNGFADLPVKALERLLAMEHLCFHLVAFATRVVSSRTQGAADGLGAAKALIPAGSASVSHAVARLIAAEGRHLLTARYAVAGRSKAARLRPSSGKAVCGHADAPSPVVSCPAQASLTAPARRQATTVRSLPCAPVEADKGAVA